MVPTLQLSLILLALILALLEGSRTKWESLLVIAVCVLAFAIALPAIIRW